jgi:outer membrane protein OmpA-like peptidoglycan-associated protein
MTLLKMRYVSLLFALTLTFSFNGYSQHFTLQDSIFRIGDCLIDRTIVFNYTSSTELHSGYLFLDSLLIFLQKNPQLSIEIGVHNDERANTQASVLLTPRRAKYTAEYLMQHGIPSDRIRAIGYESRKPLIIGAKTEEEHSLNRRVEITILKTTFRQD